jgi:DNA-binding SARP family transcriptional activator
MPTLGSVREAVLVLLIESLYLSGADASALTEPLAALDEHARDPRLASEVAPALAVARHRIGRCRGGCQAASSTLALWKAKGATLQATIGQVKLGALALDHRGTASLAPVRQSLDEAKQHAILPFLRFWIREYGRHTALLATTQGGTDLLVRLLESDPEYWRMPLLKLLPDLTGDRRATVLRGLLRVANRATVEYLAGVSGQDVSEARHQLVQQLAARIYIRSFGSLTIQRGDRQGPATTIDKRRLRALLGLLVVHSGQVLSRDTALDVLWPEADPIAAVNSLNQSVYQLRRVLNPQHRDGDSPQYILSAPDALQLNPDLVRSDLGEFRQLITRWKSARADERRDIAELMVDIVRGEFLADLKYEEWMQQTEISVHAEIRHALLPIAQGDGASPDLAIRAASALMLLDEFDEIAALALIHQLMASGRRFSAREIVIRFRDKLRDELGEGPSGELASVLHVLSAPR